MERLARLIASRPLGLLTLCLCLAALGAVAAAVLKLNLLPASRYPALTVSTQLPDAGPQAVELLVTRPIEEALRGVRGLRRVLSTSRPGRSEVTLELHTNADVSDAAQQVRGRLRGLMRKLPDDARRPVISQYNPAERPVAVLGVTGPELGPAGQWAREVLLPALRRVDGVAEVELSGAPKPEIMVECDPLRLKGLGLTVRQVALAVRAGSSTLPAGEMRSRGRELPLRTAGRVDGPAQIAAMPLIATPGGAMVRVGEVAAVHRRYEQPKELARLDGRPVAALALHQAWGAEMGGLWSRVEAALRDNRPPAGSGIKVQVVYSQARRLAQALSRLSWVALFAALAAGAVLYLFLRSLVMTLVALAALPFSLAVALLLVWALGLRLDLVALSGLALALGMMVDNAVVVIEAVHHAWQRGMQRAAGVMAGMSEVAAPIAFSTLTTVAAFVPLVLVSDWVRLTLGGFFWGLTLSLGASLLAALVLIPALLLAVGPGGRRRPWAAPAAYGRALGLVMSRPGRTALAALLLLALAALAAPGMRFTGGGGLGAVGFTTMVVTPPGTPREITARETARVEALARGLEGVKRVHSRVWSNQGRVVITFKEGGPPGGVPGAMKTLRGRLPSEGRTQYHLLPLGETQGGTTLTLNLYGPQLRGLLRYAVEVRRRLAGAAGLTDSVLRLGSPAPEMDLVVDHVLLGAYGLTARDVAEEVRAHLTGPVAVRLPGTDQEIEVRVRARPLPGKSAFAFERVFLAAPGNRMVPMTEVVRPAVERAPSELHRQNFRPVVRLTLLWDRGDVITAAAEVRRVLGGMTSPQGYDWELGDELREVERSRREMTTGVLLALGLVYLIMVAATESLLGPLLVMCAAPFAAAGALLALRGLGLAVSTPAYLGACVLSGMLVNAGIVMLHAMRRAEQDGAGLAEAARLGAVRRLRPVLMTTLTTLAGSVPLVLDTGVGSDAWRPLALTLAAGLLGSGLACLVLTPALYPLTRRLERRLGGGALAAPDPAADGGPAGPPF